MAPAARSSISLLCSLTDPSVSLSILCADFLVAKANLMTAFTVEIDGFQFALGPSKVLPLRSFQLFHPPSIFDKLCHLTPTWGLRVFSVSVGCGWGTRAPRARHGVSPLPLVSPVIFHQISGAMRPLLRREGLLVWLSYLLYLYLPWARHVRNREEVGKVVSPLPLVTDLHPWVMLCELNLALSQR